MRAGRQARATEPAAVAAAVGGIGARTACSDAERRAALMLAGALRERGMAVTRRTLWVRPFRHAPVAALAALGVAGGVVAVDHPVTGLVVAAVALVLTLGETTGRLALARRLLPARATEVVCGEAVASDPGGAAASDSGGAAGAESGASGAARAGPVTLLLSAGLDAPRPALLDRVPWPFAWVAGALALVVAACAARVAGASGAGIGVAQLVPSVVLLLGIAGLLDAAVARPLRGAGGASGLAVALAVADALAARPPRGLRVAVVGAGAGGAAGAGLRAWLRARRREGARPQGHVVLHAGPCTATPPRWWVREGLAFPLRAHPQLLKTAARAAEAERHLGARRASSGTWSGARSARALRWPALRIGGSGRPAADASPEAERAATELALAIVAALDADLAR